MAIIVGDVIHIDQVFRMDGINCVVGANYQLSDSGTTTSDLELMTSLIDDNWTATFINGIWKSANSIPVVAVCVKVRKILPTIEEDFVFLQGIAGIVITDHLPAHAAAMITKTGRHNGPGSSGRSFFPAPPEAHWPGGRLNAAGAILWNAVASFLNDNLSLGAFSTSWAPMHIQGGTDADDVHRTWVSPNIRTIRSRQAIECPV